MRAGFHKKTGFVSGVGLQKEVSQSLVNEGRFPPGTVVFAFRRNSIVRL